MPARQERFAGALVADHVPVAPLTTLRIGPVARRVITCTTTDQVIAVLGALDADPPGPVLVLAGGSNVLIGEQVTDLTVVRLAAAGIRIDGATLCAEAGAVWDNVVGAAVRYGLGGLECLSGIPGSAGATPVQNVGAYGVEVADTLRRVRLLDRRDGRVRWVDPDELGFGYRSSVLKNSPDAVVLEVEFALHADGRSAPLRYAELAAALAAPEGSRAAPNDVRHAVLALRRRKGMVLDYDDHDTWSVGSFFTNPIVTERQFAALQAQSELPVPHWPAAEEAKDQVKDAKKAEKDDAEKDEKADKDEKTETDEKAEKGDAEKDRVKLAAGWLVEQAGFGKGFPGAGAPARLSTKHALAVTNRGNATASDVASVARTVRDGVDRAFGIILTPEPVLVGVTI